MTKTTPKKQYPRTIQRGEEPDNWEIVHINKGKIDDVFYSWSSDHVCWVKNSPTVEMLANAFSRILRKELTESIINEIIRRNREENNPNVCHTHDFCDSNVIMDDALATLGVITDIQSDRQQYLWCAAWDLAVKNEFKPIK